MKMIAGMRVLMKNDCRYGSVREGAMYEQPDDSGGRAWLHVCPLIVIILIMQIVMPPLPKIESIQVIYVTDATIIDC